MEVVLAVHPEIKTGPDVQGAQLSSAEIQLVGAVGFLRGQKHVWLFRLDVNTNWPLVTRLHGGVLLLAPTPLASFRSVSSSVNCRLLGASGGPEPLGWLSSSSAAD